MILCIYLLNLDYIRIKNDWDYLIKALVVMELFIIIINVNINIVLEWLRRILKK